MGYSGLIYAVIVAGWAALLAPRWIRRNEEIERAREADAARGVRVLERRHGRVRGGHVSASARMLGRTGFSARTVSTESTGNQGDSHTAGDTPSGATGHAPAGRVSADSYPVAGDRVAARVRQAPRRVSAAARRRRMLALLVAVTVGVVTAAVAGLVNTWWVTAPCVLLAGFVLLARRAVVIERRRARAAWFAMRRQQAEPPAKRVAVFEPPTAAPPPDPSAWTPEPVPRPMYLSKAKAPPPHERTIDLSSDGAWTSGRLGPAGSGRAATRQGSAYNRESSRGGEYDDRRAVGD